MIEHFQLRLINRRSFPTKHVLVCEDDLGNQSEIAAHLGKLFGTQDEVQVTFVPGGLQAAGVMSVIGVDLIILDHDMPFGNGIDFLTWLKTSGHRPPIITFSGMGYNNDALLAAGADHRFAKAEVVGGAADVAICALLKIPLRKPVQ